MKSNQSFKICVFASGNGSNFEAIVSYFDQSKTQVNIHKLFYDQKDAYCVERAKKYQIQSTLIQKNDLQSEVFLNSLRDEQYDLLVFAGFFQVIPKIMIEKFRCESTGLSKIINIHPSLLPSFKGLHGVQKAFEYGVKVMGCTVHLVEELVDSGPILSQAFYPVRGDETLEECLKLGYELEHQLYPRTIEWVLKKEFKVEKRKDRICVIKN